MALRELQIVALVCVLAVLAALSHPRVIAEAELRRELESAHMEYCAHVGVQP